MDEDDYYYAAVGEPDVMSKRCEAITDLAITADIVQNREVKRLLIQAVEAMVWSITPPRGELVAFKAPFPAKKLEAEPEEN